MGAIALILLMRRARVNFSHEGRIFKVNSQSQPHVVNNFLSPSARTLGSVDFKFSKTKCVPVKFGLIEKSDSSLGNEVKPIFWNFARSYQFANEGR